MKWGEIAQEGQWILCPICGNKTRLKIREDTESKNFPLFCPKCKKETLPLINGHAASIQITPLLDKEGKPMITHKSKTSRQATGYQTCSAAGQRGL